jgi:hypothetical protein
VAAGALLFSSPDILEKRAPVATQAFYSTVPLECSPITNATQFSYQHQVLTTLVPTPADEAHFVGVRENTPVLKAFGAHTVIDDQEKHFLGASTVVPAGHVPGPHAPYPSAEGRLYA